MKLSVKNYTVQYKNQEKPLLQDFSFDCPVAGLYIIHGANGAGKSTLFASLQGSSLAAHVIGTVISDDVIGDIVSDVYKSYAYRHVGLVPQKYDEMLAPQYTVRENLAIALFLRIPSPFAQFGKIYIPAILSEINLPLDVPIESLSGGQRQITAIMMALQKRKNILLLDEPTATLDPANTALVMNFLVRLCKETGILILMICHDYDLQKYTEHPPIIVR